MIAALRERSWEGDDVLADQLDALLGSGAMPYLRPLPVDLDELVGILEGDPMYGGGRVDLTTGEVWPAPAVDYAREIGQEDEDESDDPDKWLWVHCEGSRDGYRDMELFIGTVRDPGRADRLEIAISGRGAFRRFKDVLARWPGELDRWHAFSAERHVAGLGPGWPTPVTTSARGSLLHDPASLSARCSSAWRALHEILSPGPEAGRSMPWERRAEPAAEEGQTVPAAPRRRPSAKVVGLQNGA
jgi:Uncharacterised protein family (UPF0158)